MEKKRMGKKGMETERETGKGIQAERWMGRRRYFSLAAMLLCICLLCLLAAGCTGGAGTASSGASQEADGQKSQADGSGFVPRLDTDTAQTIKVLSNYSNFESLEAVAEEFRKYYPNVVIEHERLDDYDNNIATRLENDPTVALYFADLSTMKIPSIAEKHAVDLTTIGIDFSQISEGSYKMCYVDGKLTSIPLWYRMDGMVVNRSLLEKEGLSIPENWQEFLDCCAALQEKGYVPVQGHSYNVSKFWYPVLALLMRDNLTEEQNRALASGEAGSALVLKDLFTRILDFHAKGYYTQENMAEYEDSYDKSILRFYEGDVPFMPCSTDLVSGMKKRESKSEAFSASPFSYEFVLLPLGEETPCEFLTVTQGFALNAACEYLDIAAEFYRFLYTGDMLNLMASVKGMPSIAAEPEIELYQNLPELPEDCIAYRWQFDDSADIAQNGCWELMNQIFSGKAVTEEQAAAAFERGVADYYEDLNLEP